TVTPHHLSRNVMFHKLNLEPFLPRELRRAAPISTAQNTSRKSNETAPRFITRFLPPKIRRFSKDLRWPQECQADYPSISCFIFGLKKSNVNMDVRTART